MSDYKRFVSYIYEYRNHIKDANRGFMKVECRNGLCQMNFALKGLCRDNNGTVEIYGFRRKSTVKGTLLEGSLLDTVPVQGGTLNHILRLDAKQMGDENYSMDELAGVIILCGDDFLYATQWDDEPMNFQGFPNRDVAPSNSASSENNTPSASADSESPTEHEDKSPQPATAFENPESIHIDSAIPNPTDTNSPDSASDDSGTTNLASPDSASDGSGTTDLASPDSASDGSGTTNLASPSSISDDSGSAASTLSEGSSSEKRSAEDIHTNTNADIHATSTGACNSQNRSYFRDGSIVNCVKITPKDLMRLHPSDLHLSNNRFIHYGYQMFGHLLVGQLADSGQTVLCVPGSYHQRECFMANMFGFPQFIRCPGHKNYPQCFGYWYRSIQPADFNNGNRIS